MKAGMLTSLSLISALGVSTALTNTVSTQEEVTLRIEYLWNVDHPKDWQTISGLSGGLAWGETDELFIADTRNARILLVDTDGDLIQEIGRSGDGPGEFREPWAIAYDHKSHSLWVADRTLSRCSKFIRRQNKYQFEHSSRIGPVTNEHGPIFDVDEDGDLWFMNSVHGIDNEFRIRNLDSDGRLLHEIGPVQEAPTPWSTNTWNRGAVVTIKGNHIAYIWHSQPLIEIWNKEGHLVLDRFFEGPVFDLSPPTRQPSGEVWFPQSFSVVGYDRAADVFVVSGRSQNRKGILYVEMDARDLNEARHYFLPIPEEEGVPTIYYLLVERVGNLVRFMGLDIRTNCLVRLLPLEP